MDYLKELSWIFMEFVPYKKITIFFRMLQDIIVMLC